MIDETLLRELADAPVAEPRPLPEIARRATVLRRRRRGASAFAAVALVAATAMAGATVMSGGNQVEVVDPAAGGYVDCAAGYGYRLRPAQAADVLYLPAEAVSGQVRDVGLTDQRASCDPGVSAAWYSRTGGRTTRTFVVEGPRTPDPHGRPGGPDPNPDARSVTVGGSPGTLYYFGPSPAGTVFWTEPDGTQWMARGAGLTAAQLLAAAGSVVFHGTRVDASVVPNGLAEQADSLGGPEPSRSELTLDAGFGGTEIQEKYQLTVTRTGDRPLLPGGRRVDVGGHPGWLRDDRGTGRHFLTWQVAEGVQGEVTGYMSADEALGFARSVTKVAPDDPRLP